MMLSYAKRLYIRPPVLEIPVPFTGVHAIDGRCRASGTGRTAWRLPRHPHRRHGSRRHRYFRAVTDRPGVQGETDAALAAARAAEANDYVAGRIAGNPGGWRVGRIRLAGHARSEGCGARTRTDGPELAGAAWGRGVETASHALRLLFGGVFDRFPRLKIILGHMGEGLPMLPWRFDSCFAVYSQGATLRLRPSEYFGRNIRKPVARRA
jgi:Amidohydrolase